MIPLSIYSISLVVLSYIIFKTNGFSYAITNMNIYAVQNDMFDLFYLINRVLKKYNYNFYCLNKRKHMILILESNP
jgi:hypothetical protein